MRKFIFGILLVPGLSAGAAWAADTPTETPAPVAAATAVECGSCAGACGACDNGVMWNRLPRRVRTVTRTWSSGCGDCTTQSRTVVRRGLFGRRVYRGSCCR